MGRQQDNPILRWAVYNVAWWIVKRRIRQIRRRRIIAAAVIGLVLVGGVLASRSGSD